MQASDEARLFVNTQLPLIVDLDGTLLCSDMLLENFWSAFSQDWRTPLKAAGWLARGRSVLKTRLADSARPDVKSLPYNADVLELIQNWHAAGGHVVLATATTQALADEVAAHLGLFDAVYGSDGTHNLKGPAKADLLVKLYGKGGFVYMGDSSADVPVWKMAAGAVTVNAPASLRKVADAVADDVIHIGAFAGIGRAHLKALRPHQWLKNILIFLPMIVAHQLTAGTFVQAMLAFVSFSLVASGVYVLNDLLDLASDRAHPRKRERPFASGTVPLSHGGLMAVGLLGLGLAVAQIVGQAFALTMLIYFALTTGYSLWLKRLAVIDICVLAGLYTMRIVAGGVATDITLSVWLLALSMFLFLSLAAVKRQAELVDAGAAATAASGRDYTANDLPYVSMVALAGGMIAVLITALYLNSDAVRELYARPDALWAICVVLLFWVLRTVLIAHRGQMNDDPVVFAAKDQVSYVCGALILAAAFVGKFP